MSGWSTVKGHLLTYLPTLSGLDAADAVSDGARLVQDDITGFAEVGGNSNDTHAGSFEQTDDDIDTLTTETGEINVRLVARSGDTDLTALQTTVEGWLTSLRTHLKTDETLGGLLMQGSTVNLGRVDVGQAQTPNGSIVENTVAIRYFTRL